MKAQRLLYNQLNTSYIYDDIDSIFLMHSSATIETNTSAGFLSLNIYSKLIAYTASKAFADEIAHSEFIQAESWKKGILAYSKEKNLYHIVVMDSSESYVSHNLKKLQKTLKTVGITLEIRPNEQFLLDHRTFKEKFPQPPVMESFYRWMRRETNILMEAGKPVGGKRNFDKDNRKFDRTFVDVEHLCFDIHPYWKEACVVYGDEISALGKEVHNHFPVTRKQALHLLDYFIENHLDRFGELEDAMYTTSDFVHHSLLSIPLNFGLLTPQEVLQAVEKTDTAINNKEGFIRQVLGWREYMYHWFHTYKEDIYDQNFFEHKQELPDWFRRPEKSELEMNCVQHVLEKVEKTGYSHHIERLMIIGNFCLLVGYNPHHVNKWFREQYADAFERVVTPNVLGMSQYADGGKLATKPYVASANYVNKMSNYCKSCRYDPKEKYGENACPLNYLYWNFITNNKETFKKGRQSFILKHLEKLDMELISSQSKHFIESITAKEEK